MIQTQKKHLLSNSFDFVLKWRNSEIPREALPTRLTTLHYNVIYKREVKSKDIDLSCESLKMGLSIVLIKKTI